MPEVKDKVRVGILRGGEGDHYVKSLFLGSDAITHLLEYLGHKYTPVDVLIDKEGTWHVRGLPVLPVELLHKVDVVWNLAHPRFSSILKSFSVPSLGAPSFSTASLNSREILREHMKHVGVKMPRHLVFPLYQPDFDGPKEKYVKKKAMQVFEKFSSPWIVRSLVPDGDIGVHVAKTFPELIRAIDDAVSHEKSILIEELIFGKTATVHTIPGFRGEDVYALSHDKFPLEQKEQLISLAKDLHNHVRAEHYLKSNFVWHPNRGIFVTGLEFSPDLREESHFHHSCQSVGSEMHQVIEHIIDSAIS